MLWWDHWQGINPIRIRKRWQHFKPCWAEQKIIGFVHHCKEPVLSCLMPQEVTHFPKTSTKRPLWIQMVAGQQSGYESWRYPIFWSAQQRLAKPFKFLCSASNLCKNHLGFSTRVMRWSEQIVLRSSICPICQNTARRPLLLRLDLYPQVGL
jgi:hypothetical protein